MPTIEPALAARPEPPRVLVAEDDPELRLLLIRALERAGLRAEGVGDGHALLLALAGGGLVPGPRALPDALVTDLRMPGFSGLDVLVALQSAGICLPVVVITAFGDAETHARARAAGARAVLDKPFTMRELLAQLLPLVQPVE